MGKFPIQSLVMPSILQVSHYKLGLPVVPVTKNDKTQDSKYQ